jgi:uncharacterized protein (TIGR00369 family)
MSLSLDHDAPPPGFAPHTRHSPLTAPWEPIHSLTTDHAVHVGLRLRSAHANSRGIAHGGLIAALADNAMGLSCGLGLPQGTSLLTVSLSVDYVGIARLGQWLQVDTTFVKMGGTLCFAQSFVRADGFDCARANATFRRIAPPGSP